MPTFRPSSSASVLTLNSSPSNISVVVANPLLSKGSSSMHDRVEKASNPQLHPVQIETSKKEPSINGCSSNTAGDNEGTKNEDIPRGPEGQQASSESSGESNSSVQQHTESKSGGEASMSPSTSASVTSSAPPPVASLEPPLENSNATQETSNSLMGDVTSSSTMECSTTSVPAHENLSRNSMDVQQTASEQPQQDSAKPVSHPPPSSTEGVIPGRKASNMFQLHQKFMHELQYMLYEFRKLERQLLSGGSSNIPEAQGSRERREKLQSFILHLDQTVQQINTGCQEQQPPPPNETEEDKQKREDEQRQSVEKLEDHIETNLLPVKDRLVKQLSAQGRGDTTSRRSRSIRPMSLLSQHKIHPSMKNINNPSALPESFRRTAPSQLGYQFKVGQGSMLTRKLHGAALGSNAAKSAIPCPISKKPDDNTHSSVLQSNPPSEGAAKPVPPTKIVGSTPLAAGPLPPSNVPASAAVPAPTGAVLPKVHHNGTEAVKTQVQPDSVPSAAVPKPAPTFTAPTPASVPAQAQVVTTSVIDPSTKSPPLSAPPNSYPLHQHNVPKPLPQTAPPVQPISTVPPQQKPGINHAISTTGRELAPSQPTSTVPPPATTAVQPVAPPRKPPSTTPTSGPTMQATQHTQVALHPAVTDPATAALAAITCANMNASSTTSGLSEAGAKLGAVIFNDHEDVATIDPVTVTNVTTSQQGNDEQQAASLQWKMNRRRKKRRRKRRRLRGSRETGNCRMSGGNGSKGSCGRDGSSSRQVEYICALCNETYPTTCEFNPWWALTQEECRKCNKLQIPRIDISSPANAIEYHPALLAHAEEANSSEGNRTTTEITQVSEPLNVGNLPNNDSIYQSDYSSGSDYSSYGSDYDDSEDEDFGQAYQGPKLSDAEASRLLVLIGHASTCPGRHKTNRQREVCQSTKYLMLHVRDCPGTMPSGDMCPFPWCRKVKHLLYHLLSCKLQEGCPVCVPKALPHNFSVLVGLNDHRRGKQKEQAKAAFAAANKPTVSSHPISAAPTNSNIASAQKSVIGNQPVRTLAVVNAPVVPTPVLSNTSATVHKNIRSPVPMGQSTSMKSSTPISNQTFVGGKNVYPGQGSSCPTNQNVIKQNLMPPAKTSAPLPAAPQPPSSQIGGTAAAPTGTSTIPPSSPNNVNKATTNSAPIQQHSTYASSSSHAPVGNISTGPSPPNVQQRPVATSPAANPSISSPKAQTQPKTSSIPAPSSTDGTKLPECRSPLISLLPSAEINSPPTGYPKACLSIENFLKGLEDDDNDVEILCTSLNVSTTEVTDSSLAKGTPAKTSIQCISEAFPSTSQMMNDSIEKQELRKVNTAQSHSKNEGGAVGASLPADASSSAESIHHESSAAPLDVSSSSTVTAENKITNIHEVTDHTSTKPSDALAGNQSEVVAPPAKSGECNVAASSKPGVVTVEQSPNNKQIDQNKTEEDLPVDKICVADENNPGKKGNSKVNMTAPQDDNPQKDNAEATPEVLSPTIPQNGRNCSDEIKKDTKTVQVGC